MDDAVGGANPPSFGVFFLSPFLRKVMNTMRFLARTLFVVMCLTGLLAGCDGGGSKEAKPPAKTFEPPKEGPKPAGG